MTRTETIDLLGRTLDVLEDPRRSDAVARSLARACLRAAVYRLKQPRPAPLSAVLPGVGRKIKGA